MVSNPAAAFLVIVNLHHHITAALYVGDRGHGHGHVQLIPTVRKHAVSGVRFTGYSDHNHDSFSVSLC